MCVVFLVRLFRYPSSAAPGGSCPPLPPSYATVVMVVVQVAAGMKTDLTVELYAIAAGVQGDRGVGQISHDLQITTETDQLLMPISANILNSRPPAADELPLAELSRTTSPCRLGDRNGICISPDGVTAHQGW